MSKARYRIITTALVMSVSGVTSVPAWGAAAPPQQNAATSFPEVGYYSAVGGPGRTTTVTTGSGADYSGRGQRVGNEWSVQVTVDNSNAPYYASLEFGSSGIAHAGIYPITYPAHASSVVLGRQDGTTSHAYGYVRVLQIAIGAHDELQLAATLVVREARVGDEAYDPVPTFAAFGFDTTVPLTSPGETALDRLGDFNGDGHTDIAVWRPSSGRWYVLGAPSVAYGVAGDIPVPADYNGDGISDFAVFRPATGEWWIRGRGPIRWGESGDIPVPGDYNGDGITDLAVWRPSTGQWWVRGYSPITYGRRGDQPTPGDFDGNGITDLALFRPSAGTSYIRQQTTVLLGHAGDIPAPGAYGHGCNDYLQEYCSVVAFFRPANGSWLTRDQTTSSQFGSQGDVPVPGYWPTSANPEPNYQTFAIFHPRTGGWYLQPFRNVVSVSYGQTGDVPV